MFLKEKRKQVHDRRVRHDDSPVMFAYASLSLSLSCSLAHSLARSLARSLSLSRVSVQEEPQIKKSKIAEAKKVQGAKTSSGDSKKVLVSKTASKDSKKLQAYTTSSKDSSSPTLPSLVLRSRVKWCLFDVVNAFRKLALPLLLEYQAVKKSICLRGPSEGAFVNALRKLELT